MFATFSHVYPCLYLTDYEKHCRIERKLKIKMMRQFFALPVLRQRIPLAHGQMLCYNCPDKNVMYPFRTAPLGSEWRGCVATRRCFLKTCPRHVFLTETVLYHKGMLWQSHAALGGVRSLREKNFRRKRGFRLK